MKPRSECVRLQKKTVIVEQLDNKKIAMFDPENISKRLFVFAVTAAVVAPRMPFDKTWAIGGGLSHGFRCLMLAVAIFNTIRIFVQPLVSRDVSLALFAFECLATSFLSLLTPYLLRLFLDDYVNYPGRDYRGKGLSRWVYATFALSFLGVVLRAMTRNDDYWVFKKIADSLTFFPVYRTLRLHNIVTSADGRYPGRGHVLSQVVMVVEAYCLFVHSADIALRLLKITGVVDLLDSAFHSAMYTTSNHYAVFTRILCHSILLNAIDESSMMLHQTSSNGESTADNEDCYPSEIVAPLNNTGNSCIADTDQEEMAVVCV